MTAKPLEIEGTWEEIVSHSDALAGGQVRVGEGAIMGCALSGVFMSQQPTDDPHNLHLLSTLKSSPLLASVFAQLPSIGSLLSPLSIQS
jgi:hypothetical protein